MKKVIVLSVLFLAAVSINYAQSYAGVYSPLNNGIEKSDDKKSNDEPIIEKTVFLSGADFQPELTGLSLTPEVASENVELLIESINDKAFKVVLFDQLGTEINNYEVTSNKVNTLNINSYPSGDYYMLIHIKDGTIKKKFEIL